MNPASPPSDSLTSSDTGIDTAWCAPQAVEASIPCVISSEALLRGQPSVAITHQGAIYRLQTTRQGKLILTK